MVNRSYLLISISIVLIFSFSIFCAQVTEDEKESEKSKEIVDANAQTQEMSADLQKTKDFPQKEYFLPVELIYCRLNENLLKDKFLPIGWSLDGKFAYIVEPADEACGCYFFKFIIQNLANDEIEWIWDYNDEGVGDDLKTVWQKNYNTFKTQLHKYGIIQKDFFDLDSTIFSYKEKDYSIALKTTTKIDKDYGYDAVYGIDIFLESPQLGSKRVYSYLEEDYSVVLNAVSTGYIKSPYQDYILIVYYEEIRGYEGPPNVIALKLTSCHLTKDFDLPA
jgi:hypothetical protein